MGAKKKKEEGPSAKVLNKEKASTLNDRTFGLKNKKGAQT
jgi:hypothetical protein